MLRRLPSSRRVPHPLPRVHPHKGRLLSFTHASKARSSSSQVSKLLYTGVGLGAVSLVAAYLFWPDHSRAAPTYANALLSPTHFTPVKVLFSEPCSDPSTRLITLAVPPQALPSLEESAFAPIWSIYVKDDDIQVERPFTPLNGLDKQGHMKFWVRKYANGEVGRWLHSKKPGDEIEIRGPLKTWPWRSDDWDEIVMISGGTGITPFFQLISQTLLNDDSDVKTRFTLLHSSRTPAELPPPAILDPLRTYSHGKPDKLRLSLFVDSLSGGSHTSVPSSVLAVGRIGRQAIEVAIGGEKRSWWRTLFRGSGWHRSEHKADRKVLFLVCGPDPMVAAIAGAYGRNFSQGEVGGILAELGYSKDDVWKL